MAAVDLKGLIGKLNEHARRALEAAAGLTLSRTHYNVEVEHWLLKLLDTTNSDIPLILRHYEIDLTRLLADLTRTLDRLKTGNARPPSLSPQIVALIREAWLLASVQFGGSKIRSGHLFCALLADESLSPLAREASSQLLRIQPEALRRDLPAIIAASEEASEAGASLATGEETSSGGRPAGTAALDQYTIDLTALAKAGKIDPVLGRDGEIRQLIDILTRRRQNNPILTGEPGVGKTAVVEGFARRIAAGDVPVALREVSIRTLDLGLLQAGAGVKGEFENRLKSVIEEVKSSPKPIIVFIDEAHTLIGAGGQAGQGDAANLLKPALARGEFRTIAATTWAEYKKYFEKDAALTRRFQVVKVEEPAEAVAVAMMRGMVETLERHHSVRILDQAILEAVRLSHRYIPARQLPDKSVSLLDTACARVAMSQSATPAAIEDRRRRLQLLDTETDILRRETAAGGDHAARLAAAAEEKILIQGQLEALETRWREEGALVERVRTLGGQLEQALAPPAASSSQTLSSPPAAAEVEAWRHDLQGVQQALADLQGAQPLVRVHVDGAAVAEVVENWTGIPVGRMVGDEIHSILSLQADLEQRVVGQSHALGAIAEAIRTSRAGLTDPEKPIGVFLMVGTSGVGKTETALALADLLYGGEQNITVINMSEFKEEHKVSLLMGSPPGYVGYGEGGVLTEAVRRRPYSVVLLDEMEKAHPGVQDIFYQVFDKGMLRDGEGRDIDFKNTLIIMTSNAGTDLIHKLCADPETIPDAAGLAEALRPELLKVFKPAFLGRVTTVPYFPLADGVMRQIVGLKLAKIGRRIAATYKADFSCDSSVVDAVIARCREVESGARNIDAILNRNLLPELSGHFLARMADGGSISAVRVITAADGGFVYEIT